MYECRTTPTPMPKPVAISHFLPALAIPTSDQTLLRELAATLVTHNLEQYNTLCVTKDGQPDGRIWKPVRKTEGLRIYRERPSAPHDAARLIPSLLLLGSAVGTLDDVMYAVVAPTDASLKIKSFYIRDGVVESKVLEELVDPTVEEPFHHVSVQWRLYETCDYVTLETAGVMETPWGERVGYTVSHSVGFATFPALTELGIPRGNRSVCSLYRQKAHGTVECYTRGFFDTSTSVFALQTIATQWLSVSRHMKCAQMKKLAWHLRQPHDDVDEMPLLTTKTKRAAITCRVCTKSFTLFLPGSKKYCQSCDAAVCSRCCTKKLVYVLSPDHSSVLETKGRICSRCVHKANKSDAVAIARDEVIRMSW
ncbi:hypothetical protein PsorP6_017641 [Peronosclerospora sorghi]|uniref:Uncharacterized protein n=1 Tax=Peronosclerospora sorghi TaxID=230839 RepID=A0ACC0WKP1_9STRA|nr:hypothetical protein PsorP6_017641 [Peronosclerospora sorghi]